VYLAARLRSAGEPPETGERRRIETAKAGAGRTHHSSPSLFDHSPLRRRQLAAESAALFRPTLAQP
jgi:hypothetical protein